MDQRQRKLMVKGVSCLALAVLLAGQVITASAKTKKEKLKSATGMITSIAHEDGFTLLVSKKNEKGFTFSNDVIVLREEIINENTLDIDQIVSLKGKGVRNTIVISKLTVLNNQKFKSIRSKKQGTAYGERKKNTEIKARIISKQPFKVKNYYGQVLSVQVEDNSIVVKESAVVIADLTKHMKAKVIYSQQGDQLIAKQIHLPYVMNKQAKK